VGAIVYSTADKNPFFSIPAGIIRRRANLPPPAPGQPGPFSLGSPGVLEQELSGAGFGDVEVRAVDAPLRTTSAAECVRFERESFGALHQMLSGLDASGRAAAWEDIEQSLRALERDGDFDGPPAPGSGTVPSKAPASSSSPPRPGARTPRSGPFALGRTRAPGPEPVIVQAKVQRTASRCRSSASSSRRSTSTTPKCFRTHPRRCPVV